MSVHIAAGASPVSQEPHVYDNDLKVEVVYDGINFPTNIAFLGPNDILVLEKDRGTVQRIVDGTMLDKPLLDLPVSNKGERGMLGIAIQENNDDSKGVFLYYTESQSQNDTYEQDPKQVALYKYEFRNDIISNPELIFSLPANSEHNTGFHVGGEVTTGPDGNVYFSVGDMDNKRRTESQNHNEHPSDGTGAIYRITQEGKAVESEQLGEDNPISKFYAYGIRNSFGMDFDPISGNLWDTENGHGFGDEINLVKPGFNSGWEKVQGMESQNDHFEEDKLVDFNGHGKYRDPEFVWNKTVGPTAIKFLSSDKYGQEYQNDLFVGDVNNGNLYHFDLNDDRTELKLNGTLADKVADIPEELEPIIFGTGFGAITDIQIGPDGYLYLVSIRQFGPLNTPLGKYESKGTIYRIVPASI
jgi:glucose/arabinose dehydrogenase